ncbi:MAG TPA: NADH-quinone oxidoreductase subunit J [Candidatus Limnocylindria bacterium]|nr:NADH-quinone oxidoreductase subunit J [Candidatus Limnocylindria bacterium]
MTLVLFVAFAAVLIGCSLMTILHRNPVTSALFLVLAFCSLAGLYLLLHAEFLAMVQVIVYAGAIMVLFLFVIMYLNLKRDVEHGLQFALRRGAGWLLGALLLAEAALLVGRRWSGGPVTQTAEALPAIGNTQALGQVLYTRYLFPFEITSIVLLVAMIGAVVIAQGRGPKVGATEKPNS